MDLSAALRFAHVLGLCLMAAGLVGVFVCDLRARATGELGMFAQLAELVALFYDALVVPGAVLLLASGAWLIVEFHGGWEFLGTPWLAGMVLLFMLEFIEGNTVTRLFFLRLRRLAGEAVRAGEWTPNLRAARAAQLASFTHFLDLPLLGVLVALGVFRPDGWGIVAGMTAAAVLVALVLHLTIGRRRGW